MRNWHPFLDDVLSEMAESGIGRALAIILAAHRSYSSCGQYRQNVADARRTLGERGHSDVEVFFAPGWHAHPGFVAAHAARIEDARRLLPGSLRGAARIVFTAHSIPRSMAGCARYVAELEESAGLVAAAVDAADWQLVYQSRSGRPTDPWLEPDVCDYLRAARDRGLQAAVLAPLGFLADHIEVRYDLDTEAAAACRAVGLPMRRALAINDHPAFLDALADVVRAACARVGGGRPLPNRAGGAARAHGGASSGALIARGRLRMARRSPLRRSRGRHGEAKAADRAGQATGLAAQWRSKALVNSRAIEARFLVLDLVALHHVDELAVAQQGNRRRGGRVPGEVAARALRRLDVRTGEDGGDDVGAGVVPERQGRSPAGPCRPHTRRPS